MTRIDKGGSLPHREMSSEGCFKEKSIGEMVIVLMRWLISFSFQVSGTQLY